jgi:transcriptional regulator GlxA family with amidase domain
MPDATALGSCGVLAWFRASAHASAVDRPSLPRGTISQVTRRPAAEQHLRDLVRLRRVRDRIDREYALPLDVEALARGAHMSAGHLSRQFRLACGCRRETPRSSRSRSTNRTGSATAPSAIPRAT